MKAKSLDGEIKITLDKTPKILYNYTVKRIDITEAGEVKMGPESGTCNNILFFVVVASGSSLISTSAVVSISGEPLNKLKGSLIL